MKDHHREDLISISIIITIGIVIALFAGISIHDSVNYLKSFNFNQTPVQTPVPTTKIPPSVIYWNDSVTNFNVSNNWSYGDGYSYNSWVNNTSYYKALGGGGYGGSSGYVTFYYVAGSGGASSIGEIIKW